MKLIQFEALFIRDFSTVVWPFPLHSHNHFELMYIRQGRGVHILNGKKSNYFSDSVFFLLPEDEHDFQIEEETHFSVIKFLPGILKGGINTSNTDFWDNLLHGLARKLKLNLESHIPSFQLEKLRSMIEVLILDWRQRGEKTSELHTHLLRSILLILNNSFEDNREKDILRLEDPLIDRIQNYIHAYISYPDKLSVKELSEVFRMSESGLRVTFRKKMGIPLREYIYSLKLQLIKERIVNSSSTFSEIARDFGFTDPSHFHRFFVHHTGHTPMFYRKENLIK
ncbi:helix-turn-helix domain-containing protein [Chryseobacterium sp. JK1]|uniref:helix-turn-helix domain-containing protein n=1 Tax=Chryseobacterium sp. JK1 TaxID=874294 RepID=UPI003D68BFC2